MGRHSKFDASFMAKVAIEALQEKDTLPALAQKYGVSPRKIERKVGQLTLECDFFADACEDAGLKVR